MRAPEHRYGTNNLILYIALVVLAVVAVGAIVYVVVGRGSSEDAEPKNIAVPTIAAPIVIPTAIPLPATPVPAPASAADRSMQALCAAGSSAVVPAAGRARSLA